MLTIRQEQYQRLASDFHARRLAIVRDRLKMEYAPIANTASEGGYETFENWFNRWEEKCAEWGVTTPGNIESICHYSIAFHPGFPDGEHFVGCRLLLEDAVLDEDTKVSQLNHALLFIQ